MLIDHRGSGKFIARVCARGQTINRAFNTRKAAVAWARDIEDSINAGATSAAGLKVPMTEIIDRSIREVDRSTAKDKRMPRWRAEWWRKRIGKVKLGDASPMLLKRHLIAEYDDAAGATYNHLIATASCIFKTAIDDHLTATNPALMLRRRKLDNDGTGRALNEGECRALIAACDEIDATLALAVRLALATGARQGELLKLAARRRSRHREDEARRHEKRKRSRRAAAGVDRRPAPRAPARP